MTGIRRNILFSIAERYAGFAINLAAMIILSRLLTPAETGLYSIAAALINIAQALRNFGVYIYLLQEKELTDEKIGSAAGISLVIAGLLAAAFILAAETIASFYNSHALTQLIFILSGNFIIVAYTAVGHGLLTRDMNFRPVMVISIAGTVTNATVSVVLAALGFGAACLAWASLSGVVVVLLGYVVVLRRRALIPPNLKHWRTIFRFGVFSSASGILDEMNNRSPDLIIGRLVSLEGVGLFSR
ncbi:MAG: oligosaccharide flippase family protein, partial [Caulobacteraceae bacterium]